MRMIDFKSACRHGAPLLAAVALLGDHLPAQEPVSVPVSRMAWVVEDADGDHLPDRRGNRVSVMGTLTMTPRPSGDTAYYSYVQDGTAGAQLLLNGYALNRYRVGDVVRASGILSATSG